MFLYIVVTTSFFDFVSIALSRNETYHRVCTRMNNMAYVDRNRIDSERILIPQPIIWWGFSLAQSLVWCVVLCWHIIFCLFFCQFDLSFSNTYAILMSSYNLPTIFFCMLYLNLKCINVLKRKKNFRYFEKQVNNKYKKK